MGKIKKSNILQRQDCHFIGFIYWIIAGDIEEACIGRNARYHLSTLPIQSI